MNEDLQERISRNAARAGRAEDIRSAWFSRWMLDSHAVHRDKPTSFQARVRAWVEACFGPYIADDKTERAHRFLEEALELAQSVGCSEGDAHELVAYVYGRPVGEPAQEVGGTMVTLAALCAANELDMHADGETELARIEQPEIMAKVRAKQAAKPKIGPLPGPSAPQTCLSRDDLRVGRRLVALCDLMMADGSHSGWKAFTKGVSYPVIGDDDPDAGVIVRDNLGQAHDIGHPGDLSEDSWLQNFQAAPLAAVA